MSNDVQQALEQKAETFRKSQQDLYAANRQWEMPCPHYLLFQNDALFKMMALNMERDDALRMRRAITMLTGMFDITTFMHVSEAWMRKVSKDEDPEMFERMMEGIAPGTLAKDPLRVEVLNVFAGDQYGNRLHLAWEINRTAKRDEDILVLTSEYRSWEDKGKGEASSCWDLWPDKRKAN